MLCHILVTPSTRTIRVRRIRIPPTRPRASRLIPIFNGRKKPYCHMIQQAVFNCNGFEIAQGAQIIETPLRRYLFIFLLFGVVLPVWPSSSVQGFLSVGGGSRHGLRRGYGSVQGSKKIKLLMLGDSGVGKSSLMDRFTEDQFNLTTVRVSFSLSVSLGVPLAVFVFVFMFFC